MDNQRFRSLYSNGRVKKLILNFICSTLTEKMMKKYQILSVALALGMYAGSATAQSVAKAAASAETKMELFSSKTGAIVKFTDFNQPAIPLIYGGSVETRIRKLASGTDVRFFYQIEQEGKYGSKTASIEYSDLLEVLKALTSLKAAL